MHTIKKVEYSTINQRVLEAAEPPPLNRNPSSIKKTFLPENV